MVNETNRLSLFIVIILKHWDPDVCHTIFSACVFISFNFSMHSFLTNRILDSLVWKIKLVTNKQVSDISYFLLCWWDHRQPRTNLLNDFTRPLTWNKNFALSNELSKANDEGLTLETSVFWIFHGGNSTFVNLFDKTKFLFHSPSDAAPQFLSKLEIG